MASSNRIRQKAPRAPKIPQRGVRPIRAKYTRSQIEEWVGNEYIECLGDPASTRDLARLMSYRPPYDRSERTHSTTNRRMYLRRLKRVYVPLTAQHSIAQTLGEMIRSGYEHRAPAKPEFHGYLQDLYDRKMSGGTVESAPDLDPICDSYAIIGISGVGKTRLVRRALAQFPKYVLHPKLGLHSIPYIIVECPHNGTVKQLILNFFKQLDNIIGTDYEGRFSKQRATNEALIREVNAAAMAYGIGLIVIDEIQHASVAATEEAKKLFMNFIVRFVNESIAPVVLIGTMSSLDLITQDFRIARRMMGALLRNYPQTREWNHFLKKIWRYQWTQKVTPLTPELNAKMYARTQGVLSLASKLYRAVQRRAIDSGSEEVTESLIDKVADEEFTRVQPMLDALASGDMKKLIKFGDLYVPEAIERRVRAKGNDSSMLLADLMDHINQETDEANDSQIKTAA